jgi:gas vesicle protein
MYTDQETTTQGSGMAFVCGLFTGMAIGAGMGLLFAPRAGAELRGRIADSASTVGRRMSDTFDAVADAGRDAYQQARDVASTAGEQFSRMASDVSRSAQEGADAIRASASRARRDAQTPTSTHA